MTLSDCEHADVKYERAYDERPEGSYFLGFVGTCLDCSAPMTLTGDEDEEGHPTWAETFTPEELAVVWNQSGGSVTRA